MLQAEDRSQQATDHGTLDETYGKQRSHGSGRGSNRRADREQAKRRSWLVVSLARRFWFELLAAALLTLGVFLLVEQLQIKAILWRTLAGWANSISSTAYELWRRSLGVLVSAERSDLVGVALVLVGLGMITTRLRRRAIERHPELIREHECPTCRRDLYRVRRRPVDRLMEFLFWIRMSRYRCSKCSFHASVWRRRCELE